MKILLTGASGFVGSRLVEIWENPDELLSVSLRSSDSCPDPIDNIKWKDIQSVIHLAGLAHQMDATNDAPYFEINEHLTVKLAQEAKANGVKHFIFTSTIKVYGDQLDNVSIDTPCHPDDAYGKSKLNAETKLNELATNDFIVSIIRPPLIIGAGAKGNLQNLMQLLQKPFLIPLGKIDNRRSMIFLDNLIALISHLVINPKSGIFLCANEAISTSELAKQIRLKMGYRRPLLMAIPIIFRRLIKKRKPELYSRLFGSFYVDYKSSYDSLEFKNPYPLQAGVDQMVKEFRKEK